MGDFEDDPIFGSHMRSMRHMNNMMNSLFSDPFGLMGPPALTNGSHRSSDRYNPLQMMPFGFPPMPSFNMGGLFQDFNNIRADNGACHSYMSSSVMTMTSGPDGRPQVYQESTSTRTAPGGIKETKKTVSDSRTGTKKMAIGHHIGDRAHILEREHNLRSGDQEERQEFINLDEEEADHFNTEWETRTRRSVGAIDRARYGTHNLSHNRNHTEQLALPAPTGSSRHSSSRWLPTPRRGIRTSSSKPSDVNSTSRSRCSTSKTATVTEAASTSSASSGSRKREHSPDSEPNHKRHSKPISKD